jgi:hypothetical protein
LLQWAESTEALGLARLRDLAQGQNRGRLALAAERRRRPIAGKPTVRLAQGRVPEGLRPVRNSIWVTEEGETHYRGVSTAVGGRPVRMPERGPSVGRGSRQSD